MSIPCERKKKDLNLNMYLGKQWCMFGEKGIKCSLPYFEIIQLNGNCKCEVLQSAFYSSFCVLNLIQTCIVFVQKYINQSVKENNLKELFCDRFLQCSALVSRLIIKTGNALESLVIFFMLQARVDFPVPGHPSSVQG